MLAGTGAGCTVGKLGTQGLPTCLQRYAQPNMPESPLWPVVRGFRRPFGPPKKSSGGESPSLQLLVEGSDD